MRHKSYVTMKNLVITCFLLLIVFPSFSQMNKHNKKFDCALTEEQFWKLKENKEWLKEVARRLKRVDKELAKRYRKCKTQQERVAITDPVLHMLDGKTSDNLTSREELILDLFKMYDASIPSGYSADEARKVHEVLMERYDGNLNASWKPSNSYSRILIHGIVEKKKMNKIACILLNEIHVPQNTKPIWVEFYEGIDTHKEEHFEHTVTITTKEKGPLFLRLYID